MAAHHSLARSVLAAAALAAAGMPLFAPHLHAQELRAPRAVAVDSIFHGIGARAIGPAGTSGRISAIDAVRSDPRVIWVGSATGGLWKSTDGGFTWSPMMDREPVNSIGMVKVNQAAPHIVWVGTGEGSVRNSMGVGRGVWRTLDGGLTWTHLGLERTERIEDIVLHPTDPDVAWVSALGPAWSDGEERGVFKTTDGGKTWRKTLYVDPGTGAFSLVADPSNPNHLLASTWTYRRWPWFFRSGGAGSGLWKSWDGGETWRRLTAADGLPQGELGRIGIAFAVNEPRVAYALVEAEKSALLRSDDGGESWRAVNTEVNVSDRPFYYNRIAVDPTNENRVYRVSGYVSMSEDGGRTFRNVTPWSSVHVDHHALWTHPDGQTLIAGNDGGVYFSHNRGGSWRFVENLVLAQFYHLAVDDAVPFNVYGGLQDNGTWMGPSQVWETPSFKGEAVVAHHWHEIGFGDGFAALPDPTEPGTGYSMSQGGYLRRFDVRTNEERSVRPPRPDDDTELRFNWNAGIALDPFDPKVVYYGSQFVHRSPDRGETWEIISPDLTTDDPEKQKAAESGGLTYDVTAAENHTTILTIAPSPLERGVIWVGTDDGNVQLTRDGGRTWTNVAGRIPGVPAGSWVPHIEASKHDAATAYVAMGDHQRGNWTSYLLKTTDWGQTWRALSPGQLDGHVHVVEEDPVEPNLLFAGTEFGLFFSSDGGVSWRKWTHGGFPHGAATRALVVHPRDHDLAVGTHGRGAWIIDDIRPLRAMARDRALTQRSLHLFEIPPAIRYTSGMRGPFYFPGDTKYQGPNRPYGALISYWVDEATAAAAGDTTAARAAGEAPEWSFGPRSSGVGGPATIEILEDGTVIRTLKGPAKRGVNRLSWALERAGRRSPGAAADAPEPAGNPVVPGRYAVRVTVGDHVATGEVEVLPDPRSSWTVDGMRTRLEVQVVAEELQGRLSTAVDRLGRTRAALELHEKELGRWNGAEASVRDTLSARTKEVKRRTIEILNRLRLPPDTKGIVDDRTAMSRLGDVLGQIGTSPGAPSPGQLAELERATRHAEALLADVEGHYADVVAPYESALREAGFRILDPG